MPKIQYQDIKLQGRSLVLVQKCNEIIEAHQAEGQMLTLRQLYYRLVAANVIKNDQKEYKRVGAIISDARLSGLIDWSAMEDRTRDLASVAHWASPQNIIDESAKQYRVDKWLTQKIRCEVWIEKDTLAGVVEGVCAELDISFMSCRGYTSQSAMWESAIRILGYIKAGQQVQIVHMGDHDPSGQDMSRDIEDRIRMFLAAHIGMAKAATHFKLNRVALNMDQIRKYKPPPNPAKVTDTRFQKYADEHGEESWEMEALENSVIIETVRQAVLGVRDEVQWAAAVMVENQHRDLLSKCSTRWDEVVKMLKKPPPKPRKKKAKKKKKSAAKKRKAKKQAPKE